MGKSMHSKWRKKMRNVKREKYAKKDLERLKNMLDTAENADEEMKELYTVKKSSEVKKEQEEKKAEAEEMDIDKPKKTFDKKTLRDEHGHYPVWMNSRQVKKHKAKLQGKKPTKKSKWKGKKKSVW